MSDSQVDISGQSGADQAPAPVDSRVAWVCQWLCNITMVVMLIIISAEAIARLFGLSLEMADEVGGYLLVALTFLSLSVCQVTGTFHHLGLLQPRLGPHGRAMWAVAFDLMALTFSAVLLWQLGRLELQSWQFGDVAPTQLQTPLWLPRLSMPIGTAALCFVLLASLIASIRRLGRVLNGQPETRA